MKIKEMEDIYNHFGDNALISRQQLKNYILNTFPNKKSAFLSFYIFDLKKAHFAYPIDKERIVISKRKQFKIDITNNLVDLNEKIYKLLEDFNYCIWQKSDLQSLMRHQFFKNTIYICVEKEFIDSLKLYLLLNKGNFNVYDYKEIERAHLEDNPIIIEHLLKKAPINKKKNTNKLGSNLHYNNQIDLPTPKLEKILVDLFVDKKGVYAVDSGELKEIFINSFNFYQVNLTTLLQYAKSRNTKPEIIDYIEKTIKFDIERAKFK